jgi:translation initiation factor 1A
MEEKRINAETFEKGGKNRRRGKNENDNEKRELTFKEEGQGKRECISARHTGLSF